MTDPVPPVASQPATGPARWLASAAGVLVIDVAARLAGEYHWWANFILFTGAALVAIGVTPGRSRRVGWHLVLWLGLIVVLVGALLTFNAMGAGWPLMISVPCLGLATTVALATTRLVDPSARAVAGSVIGLAFLGVLLGITLLLVTQDLIDFGDHRWWGVFTIAAGVVPIPSGALLLIRRKGADWFSVAVLLIAVGAATIFCGIREIEGWDAKLFSIGL